MVKFGIEAFRLRRKLMIILGITLTVAVPVPFIISWLETLGPQPIKNFTGIPITFRPMQAIKIKYRRISKIKIKYTNSLRIPIAYHSLSVIKITYRNGNNGGLTDDPRFPTVRVRQTTFKVTPRMMLP